METGHFLTIFTLFISSTVSGSEDHVYVQTGDSVKLEIKNKTLPRFNLFSWKKNTKDNVVKFPNAGKIRLHSSFNDRVEFNKQTFSLTLKNMQKNDSGNYSAIIHGDNETPVGQYNILVIDPVDSPVLEASITLISTNSCFLNFSCSAHVLQLRTSYDNNCSEEEVTSGIQTLTLYCLENVVFCNYSNPVSWINATLEIKQLCTPNESANFTKGHKENSPFPLHWILVIAAVPLLVFTAVSVFCCFHKKQKTEAQPEDLTIYAQVQPKNEGKRSLEMLEQSANLQTVYGFTEDYKEPRNTSQTTACAEIQTQAQPENHPSTTYSTIGQSLKPAIPTETDQTIYSVVSKHSRGRKPKH